MFMVGLESSLFGGGGLLRNIVNVGSTPVDVDLKMNSLSSALLEDRPTKLRLRYGFFMTFGQRF